MSTRNRTIEQNSFLSKKILASEIPKRRIRTPNAIAQTGELVGVNGVGTGIGAWPYAAKNLVLVSGVNKIVPSLDAAIRRVREFAYSLENERVQRAAGNESVIGKLTHYEYEKQDERTELVLIDETQGY